MILQYRHHPPALNPRPTTCPALLFRNCHYPLALNPNQLLAPPPPALNPPTDYLPRSAPHTGDLLASYSPTCTAHSPKVHGNSHLPGAHHPQEKGNHYPLESLALKVRHQSSALVLDLGCPSKCRPPPADDGHTERQRAYSASLSFRCVVGVRHTEGQRAYLGFSVSQLCLHSVRV